MRVPISHRLSTFRPRTWTPHPPCLRDDEGPTLVRPCRISHCGSARGVPATCARQLSGGIGEACHAMWTCLSSAADRSLVPSHPVGAMPDHNDEAPDPPSEVYGAAAGLMDESGPTSISVLRRASYQSAEHSNCSYPRDVGHMNTHLRTFQCRLVNRLIKTILRSGINS